MFDVFTIGIPSSVTSKAGSGKGAAGAFGMGFLAALLSTPCSFGILAGVFAWAQTQPLPLSTLAFILMGVGMAIPYAILVSVPSLLASLPRPGTWMEIVRKSMGFILLIIAVKLIGALGKDRLVDLLYYSVILSFCLWMWGGWVGFSTAAAKKWTVRIIALAIAVTAGWMLLPEKTELISWQEYDAVRIAQARREQQPVLIKFTADWCTSCSWVDKTVYQRKEVAELINQKGILAIKADTTKLNFPATIDLADKNKYNEPGVPVTVVFLPDGSKIHIRGLMSKNDLKKVLDKVPDKGK
jgi:thiol:disulfide interchange protein DsbD